MPQGGQLVTRLDRRSWAIPRPRDANMDRPASGLLVAPQLPDRACDSLQGFEVVQDGCPMLIPIWVSTLGSRSSLGRSGWGLQTQNGIECPYPHPGTFSGLHDGSRSTIQIMSMLIMRTVRSEVEKLGGWARIAGLTARNGWVGLRPVSLSAPLRYGLR